MVTSKAKISDSLVAQMNDDVVHGNEKDLTSGSGVKGPSIKVKPYEVHPSISLPPVETEVLAGPEPGSTGPDPDRLADHAAQAKAFAARLRKENG